MSIATTYPSFDIDIFAFLTKSSRNDFNGLLDEDTRRREKLASEQARRDAIDKLLELEAGYQERNWDREGADPIPCAAIGEAHAFLLKFPSTLPLPEVIPEPDGYLGLEWYTNKRLLYVVSFNGKGALSCSGLVGHAKTYGTWYMDESIPGEILRAITKVVQ